MTLPPDAVRIRPVALAKLRMYARRCPFEIGGLGQVVAEDGGLLITDLFILPQRVSVSDTELTSEGLFTLLAQLVADGVDVGSTRLWWHSHAEMDVSWSETDTDTIENLPGDFWVAVVTNRKGDILCRLDMYTPERRTWDLPLVEVAGEAAPEAAMLEAWIDQDILAKVRSPIPLQDVLGATLEDDLADAARKEAGG